MDAGIGDVLFAIGIVAWSALVTSGVAWWAVRCQRMGWR